MYGILGGLFPSFEQEQIDEIYFNLTYIPYKGSGLCWTRGCVDELEIGRIQWYIDRLDTQRRREADAIKSAK